MGEREIWVRDIAKLDELGRRQMTTMANDLLNTRKRIDSLKLNPAAFGENPIRHRMEVAYESVRTEFGKQINAAYVGMRDSGEAVSQAAKNYRAIEKKLSS
ncbi:hypothetical protein ACFY4C_38185 [Actinomadura viridis]|uniref:hypothetical protein n=1 Tax=Actinomadura viridis TaxID=58110 RepID=UPI0036C93CCF